MLDETDKTIFVAGAGASGLAFALECAVRGRKVRLFDKRPSRSLMGKATGVAAGVWRQLERFGVSPDSVAAAIPMRNFEFYDDAALVSHLPVPEVMGEAPAQLFPQGELEQQLESVLASMGVPVEYGTEFVSYEEHESGVRVRLRTAAGGQERTETCSCLIGADGAHSKVREATGLPFVGRDYPEQWSVAEIATSQWQDSAQARLFLQSDGVGLFLSQPKYGVVQGILNAGNVTERLFQHFPDAELRYERQFKVALKRVPRPVKGRVWLIGDAAHVQSPVGGQGLNLAIWDGLTLAEGLLTGNQKIAKILARRARQVLFFTDFDYRMLAARNTFIRSLRNQYWASAAKYPILAGWFFRIISGLW